MLAAGAVVQIVNTASGAMATGTTIIPSDNTIPQNTEGTALSALDTTITPKAAGNKLVVQAIVNASASIAAQIIVAMFQDSGAGAVAVGDVTVAGTSYLGQVSVSFTTTAASTSATTFKLRYGPPGAATVTINGSAGAQLFGGTLVSSLTVTEIAG